MLLTPGLRALIYCLMKTTYWTTYRTFTIEERALTPALSVFHCPDINCWSCDTAAQVQRAVDAYLTREEVA